MAPAFNLENNNFNFIQLLSTVIPPLLLIITVLGSIFLGIATPTESASVGAIGALILASCHKRLNLKNLHESMRHTTKLTSMVFMILIGATAFGLVFRGIGGDKLVLDIMSNLPAGAWGFLFVSMLLIFILGINQVWRRHSI